MDKQLFQSMNVDILRQVLQYSVLCDFSNSLNAYVSGFKFTTIVILTLILV